VTLVHAETGEVVARPGPLEQLEAARALLAEASDLRTVVEIRDRAEAVRTYVSAAQHGLVLQNEAAELKLRAERKAGELLAADPAVGAGKGPTLGPLGLTKNDSSRWQRIASLPEAEFDAYIAEAHNERRELTTAGALKLAKRLLARDKPEAPHLRAVGDGMTDTFPAIVIDPPWQYDNRATRGAAEDHYPTMSFTELEDLELPAADNAHLYLWVTNSFISQGFDLLVSWGFTYKTMLTWCKPSIGMGNYFRNNTEHVLFGVKGSLPTQRNDIGTWFQAAKTRHSAKPESFYDLVEKSSPGPWLEMFARRRRMGWHVWGNEA
jgi:N6-adenosine-specific RNA methylase IME4